MLRQHLLGHEAGGGALGAVVEAGAYAGNRLVAAAAAIQHKVAAASNSSWAEIKANAGLVAVYKLIPSNLQSQIKVT